MTFDGTVGLFTPSSAGTTPSGVAVLFASPWGLEEMCTRKFWRIISEKLADRGIASLRFDYPSTGDALDDLDFGGGLSVWSDSVVSAATHLKALSGCDRIVLVSQGLGAVVATTAAERLEGLAAIAYLAPVVSGRLHIRELAVWSKVVDENLGLADEQRDKSGVSIASLTMPGQIADEVRKVNLLTVDRQVAPRVLVVGRADRPSDKEFAARLRALGADVDEQAFEGYDKLVSNPVIVKMPLPVADNLANWIAALPSEPASASTRSPGPAVPLAGDGFTETPVRFGVNSRLSGVLCEPSHGRAGATVLFLTSAYDRHAGWGRATVALARALARSGIPSLRFDTANVGDSPPVPGRPDQVLYHSDQNADVSEAIDFLETRRLTPVVTAGRCSGAYLGLQASLVEPRIAGNVSVNPAVFRWRPGRSVEDMIVNGARSLRDYRKRALRAETFKRILRGEVNTVAAVRNIAKSVGNRIKGKVLHAFRGFLPEGRAIYGAFRTLHQRSTPISLIYSENDLGLEQYDFYFGHDGAGLARFPNVSPEIIPDADHNLTPEHARKVYLEALREMAFRFPLEEDVYSKTGGSVAAE
ncbi:alpha/beta superfamily hydrolase [Neorhizobium galegae]|uniref:alpha/beta hydrolase n=1 Tax=Neorhizobium galegae TaxID=399 RepID=UPI00278505E7|nr:alpha/beta hydrolase [Neorhizobium galegae]MDQ0138033.1 alpha/beta superfamily hydrolase [Neorhizobium galegae]